MTPQEFKAIREKLNMTQPDLAQILHLNVRSIQRMEKGEYRILHSHAYRMKDLLQNYYSCTGGASMLFF